MMFDFELCIMNCVLKIKQYGNIQSIYQMDNEQCRLPHRAGHERRDQHNLSGIRDVRSDSSAGATGLPLQVWSRPQSHELPPRRLPQS